MESGNYTCDVKTFVAVSNIKPANLNGWNLKGGSNHPFLIKGPNFCMDIVTSTFVLNCIPALIIQLHFLYHEHNGLGSPLCCCDVAA